MSALRRNATMVLLLTGLAMERPAPVVAQTQAEVSVPAPRPARGFLQAGIGLLELAHVELGAFLTPHLTIEAMLSWNGVFGSRYGGGLTYAIGPSDPGRPPRHGFLIGARLMLDERLAFDSHGDDLSSYVVTPVGYGFLGEVFYFRAGVGPVIARERYSAPGTDVRSYRLRVGGPFFTVSLGFYF